MSRAGPGRVDCRQVMRALQAFLDGELDPEQAELVAEHLETCQGCGPESETLERVLNAIRALRVECDSAAYRRLADSAERLAMTHGSRNGNRQERR